MNELQKEKIRRFIEDRGMVDAVKKVFLESFLVPRRNNDTTAADMCVLAASRLAIDFLYEGFKELEKYSEKVENGKGENEHNIGL